MEPIYLSKQEWDSEWEIQGKGVAIFRRTPLSRLIKLNLRGVQCWENKQKLVGGKPDAFPPYFTQHQL